MLQDAVAPGTPSTSGEWQQHPPFAPGVVVRFAEVLAGHQIPSAIVARAASRLIAERLIHIQDSIVAECNRLPDVHLAFFATKHDALGKMGILVVMFRAKIDQLLKAITAIADELEGAADELRD